jgi:hypothetical protein
MLLIPTDAGKNTRIIESGTIKLERNNPYQVPAELAILSDLPNETRPR